VRTRTQVLAGADDIATCATLVDDDVATLGERGGVDDDLLVVGVNDRLVAEAHGGLRDAADLAGSGPDLGVVETLRERP